MNDLISKDEYPEQSFWFWAEAFQSATNKDVGTARRVSPQCKMILDHLKQGNSITQRSALMDFGVMALPRRIADLREHGHKITRLMEHNKLTGQRFARYSLERKA